MSSSADRKVEGLILHKHGIFTFGADAREAYERMIEMVTLAEERLTRGRKASSRRAKLPRRSRAARRRRADPARRLQPEGREDRGRVDALHPRVPQRRRGPQLRQRRGASRATPGRRGDAGPHHPHQELAADRAGAGEPASSTTFKQDAQRRGRETSSASTATYFDANNARVRRRSRRRSIRCRASCWCRGSACSASAAPKKDARVAADLAEAAIETITDAEAIGRFRSISRSRHVRHGILVARAGQARQAAEQAARRPDRGGHRRGRRRSAPRPRSAFAAAGAEVALLDVNEAAAKRTGARRSAAPGDRAATSPTPRRCSAAFDQVVETFGGARHRGLECGRGAGRARSARSTRPCCARASS